MDIGKAIKTIRSRHKVSQQVLAKEIGVSQGYLSLIEKGLREPGFSLVNQIANTLNVPPQFIFLLACENQPTYKRYAKPLQNITRLLDDILKTVK